MSSINQLVSEIAHIAQSPNNIALRRSIKQEIIHSRNELIRKGYNNHSISDKVLQQRIKLSLINVPDGDNFTEDKLIINAIKRTTNKVPRPTRINNNLPFHSIRTVGFTNSIEIPFIKESSAKFINYLPGMCSFPSYDYINGYIYIYSKTNNEIKNLNSIIIESIFEYPHVIEVETFEGKEIIDDETIDNNEFLLPEDLIGAIKDIVLQRLHIEINRQTNETPEINKLRG